MSTQLTPLSQEQAEEEAIKALGKARSAYDATWSDLEALRTRVRDAEFTYNCAREQYLAAKAHFHAISQRSTEGL